MFADDDVSTCKHDDVCVSNHHLLLLLQAQSLQSAEEIPWLMRSNFSPDTASSIYGYNSNDLKGTCCHVIDAANLIY